jgi:hypothetical protein
VAPGSFWSLAFLVRNISAGVVAPCLVTLAVGDSSSMPENVEQPPAFHFTAVLFFFPSFSFLYRRSSLLIFSVSIYKLSIYLFFIISLLFFSLSIYLSISSMASTPPFFTTLFHSSSCLCFLL